MRRELNFEIPIVKPISGNKVKRMNRWKETEKKNKYIGDVGLILNAQFGLQGRIKLKPPIDLYIEYQFDIKRGRDDDNYYAGSTKWLIDFLKERMWAGDDDGETMTPRVKPMPGKYPEMLTKIRIVERG